MKLRSKVELRRCRPLLGTFVEVLARARNEVVATRAIEVAFDAVARVDRLMSFHNPESDISHMNRDAFSTGALVQPWTWQVMKFSQKLACESDGLFDLTVASQLTERNYLPDRSYCFSSEATWRDIFLPRNNEVFFRRKLIVDLGGIAKGFAVDRAIDALKENGAVSGVVNAGGDLRVFGCAPEQISLRNPKVPAASAGVLRLCNRAIATSSTYFSPQALIDGRTRRAASESVSVTVAANECMIADALTKVVFARREKAAALLGQYHADALLLERDGSPSWTFQSPCRIPDPIR